MVRAICRSGSPTLEKYAAYLESWMMTAGRPPATVEIMRSRVCVYATAKTAPAESC